MSTNKLSGIGLANFAASKIKTPYVYGAKGGDGVFTSSKFNFLVANYPKIFTPNYIRKIKYLDVIDKKVCTDCSGLISWYTGKVLGSAQLYSKAYTRLPIRELDKFAIGTVLYKPGHVGVYVGKDSNGDHLCVEAKGIDYGTVCGVIDNPNRWNCGLTFSWLDYEIDKPIKDKSWRGENPYNEPIEILRNGSKGEGVKWLQWELNEFGYKHVFTYEGKILRQVKVDGDFGSITEAAVKLFQRSCKIKADGIVGPMTKQYLNSH